MVKETRITFEVKDILAFRVKCKKCLNEVTLRLDSDKGIPDSCPMCNQDRWASGSGAYGLLTALRSVLDGERGTVAEIHLEIDGEEA